MSIPIKQCLVGFVADPIPRPKPTARGGTRVQVRVRLPHWRRNPDGGYTPLKATYCTLVTFDEVAQELFARFRKGDKVIAAGAVRMDQPNVDGIARQRELFVAYHVGHDAVRTRYVVERPRMRADTLNLSSAVTGR
ncbi:single-stranded DNA-binding protein [Georgenia thermotolerans]|uniref:Single-stranded DNA-binding protein n=1 Tax=Georgenia thermotolerans TaxID=527326 RepID=A0A7J5UM30_9MICO|nr:single-stranded DNA-binding protein [Georgenia thermotolerans]KAE8763428.1 single-stranded DNA-binding protein [Georgenia thermotolerans]